MRSLNFYAGLRLNRVTERRRDTAWIEERLRAPGARLLPVWRAMNLVRDEPAPAAVFLDAASIVRMETLTVFLGESDGAAYFALDLSAVEEPDLPPVVKTSGRFVDLRAVGPVIDRQQGAMLAYARGLMLWHARHRFCGVCGAPMASIAGGHVRKCMNPDCGTEHFPRTDPAVIMLVTDGERCLLGRQKQWPQRMYSTLAGFVEPGESLEDAVAREVHEETGIAVADINYHSSQPWPFPASIMLGFTARAASIALRIDPDELEDAAWFTKDFLRQPHDPEVFRLPRPDSIARRLIEDWLAAD